MTPGPARVPAGDLQAALWHLLGNPTIASAWSQALLVAGVAAVLLRPGAPLPRYHSIRSTRRCTQRTVATS